MPDNEAVPWWAWIALVVGLAMVGFLGWAVMVVLNTFEPPKDKP
jgi:hypothetical protein